MPPVLPPPAPAGDVAADPTVREIVTANTGFCFRPLRQLSEAAPSKNIFFSPFSVSTALTLALNGAGGATKLDMVATLGLQALSQEQLNQAKGLLLPSLKNPDPKVQISVANALWADTETVFEPDFQGRCRCRHDQRLGEGADTRQDHSTCNLR